MKGIPQSGRCGPLFGELPLQNNPSFSFMYFLPSRWTLGGLTEGSVRRRQGVRCRGSPQSRGCPKGPDPSGSKGVIDTDQWVPRVFFTTVVREPSREVVFLLTGDPLRHSHSLLHTSPRGD